MNSVNLIGRITTSPILRYTDNDKAYVGFTLAVHKNKEETDFITVFLWGEQATKNMVKFVDKGDFVGVNGRLETRDRKVPNGEKIDFAKYKDTFVVAGRVDYLGSATKKGSGK